MAHARKKPNGRWLATANHPSGKRFFATFDLKRSALAWAEDLESEWRRGNQFDPDAAAGRVGDWITTWLRTRRVDPITGDKDASHLRNHILPKWADWPLGSVRRMDVAAWVADMERAGVGAHTITAVVRLFSGAMKAAVLEDVLAKNPVTGVKLPKVEDKPAFFWSREEAARIVAELPHPWDVAVDLAFHVGLRPGELLGLQVGRVEWDRGQLYVQGVVTTKGWRDHPKSSKSRRWVPIPPHLLDPLLPLVTGREAAAPVFAGARGAWVPVANFRNRFFDPAVASAGACEEHRFEGDPDPTCRGCKLTWLPGRPCPAHRIATARARTDCAACRPVPYGTPHDMRHTAASWLAMDGVDLYRIQELLGHESSRTTQKYSHLAPSAFDRIRDLWAAGGGLPGITTSTTTQTTTEATSDATAGSNPSNHRATEKREGHLPEREDGL